MQLQKNKSCSEGCECLNCTNIDKPMCTSDSSELNDLTLEEIVDTQMTDDLHKQIDENMEQVFGTTIRDCDDLSDDSDNDMMGLSKFCILLPNYINCAVRKSFLQPSK